MNSSVKMVNVCHRNGFVMEKMIVETFQTKRIAVRIHSFLIHLTLIKE